jgi:signal transduction histidine kinase
MASRFWRSAAQYFAGGVGLVLVTFVCVRFRQDIHVAAFGYLILIVLLALTSEFIGSVVLSVAAAGCLTYFFAPSLLSFRLDYLEDATTIAPFLTISFFVNGLIIQRNWTGAKLHKAQADLANVERLVTVGQLTASIGHEVNQPLSGIVAEAEACLLWLDRAPPNLDEVRQNVGRIIKNGHRAGEVIQRLRALSKKAAPQKAPLDINSVVNEAITLVQREVFFDASFEQRTTERGHVRDEVGRQGMQVKTDIEVDDPVGKELRASKSGSWPVLPAIPAEGCLRGPCWRGKLETCVGIGRFSRIDCFDQTLSAVSVAS